MRKNTYRLALTALLSAMSLVVFVLEDYLPSIPLPGAKIGLANLFSLFALFAIGWQSALFVVVVRVTLGCLATGNVGAILYSLTAGVASICLGIGLKRLVPRVSVVAIGVAMAVVHNVVQTLVYCLVVQHTGMFAYLPYLMSFGVLSGAVVGGLAWTLLRTLPETIVTRLEQDLGKESQNQSTSAALPSQEEIRPQSNTQQEEKE